MRIPKNHKKSPIPELWGECISFLNVIDTHLLLSSVCSLNDDERQYIGWDGFDTHTHTQQQQNGMLIRALIDQQQKYTLNYFIMVINVRARHEHKCTYFLRRCRWRCGFRILLIQRCSNLLVCSVCMFASEQLWGERKIMGNMKMNGKKAADNRKSKFASINCANMVAEIGVSLLVNTYTHTIHQWRPPPPTFFCFCIFVFSQLFLTLRHSIWCGRFFVRCWCCCGFLNSRTPHIYMLMMVCWLTKLRHKRKWPIVGKTGKRRGQKR